MSESTRRSAEISTGDLTPNNLPLQISSFIGRRRETTQIEALLGNNRLLTLTGPGGSGKTRLAFKVASDVVSGEAENAGDIARDGVWVVELAPLSDGGLVAQEVASVLGVRENPGTRLEDTLTEHLGTRDVLVVLDNCEHLVDACAELAGTLLRSCPGLRILATGREALGVPGEVHFSVPPLSLPDPRRLTEMESVGHYEAVSLFVDRASAVKSDFALTGRNAMAVAQVCYRLDGMPLAIELAAARMKMLSVEKLSARLDDSFALLTAGGRTVMPQHRTLRATMDWSYDLLAEEEQDLLVKLSVFSGGFTLEAVEAVGKGSGIEDARVIDLLASLVDKSLVLVGEENGEPRFRLLETVRQYGREKLEESGEAELVRRRHAEHFLALAEKTGPDPKEQGAQLRRLGAEHDNFRAALQWSLEPNAAEDAALGLRLAAALGQRRFWAAYGLGEGLTWLERGLASGGSIPDPVRAAALSQAGWIATVQGDAGKAISLLQENLAVSRELGDNKIVASALVQLGQLLAMHGGERELLQELGEEAETLRLEVSDPQTVASLLIFLGIAAMDRDDYESSEKLLGEGLLLSRAMGDIFGIALSCGTLGFLLLFQDEVARAGVAFEEALHTLRDLRDRVGMLHCLMGVASVLGINGEPARAARLWGAAEALGEAASVPLLPTIRVRYAYEAHLAAARAQVGEEAFETAWSEGRAMTPERAVEYALEDPTLLTEQAAPSPTSHPAGLSAREVEVLRLVATGMTNAQIAQELYISPRTVNAHLGSIYHKIGMSTRAEATRFASEHRLL